jgi:hypothetical protein
MAALSWSEERECRKKADPSLRLPAVGKPAYRRQARDDKNKHPRTSILEQASSNRELRRR